MAHIQKRGPSRYKARYRSPDGREHAKTFDRKGDAERWLAAIEVEKSRGNWVDPALAKQTFRAFASDWMAAQAHLAPTTRQKVRGHIDNHLIPAFGSMRLASIQPQHVRKWVTEISNTGRSPTTIGNVASTLGRIMNTAVRDGVLGRSPCAGVELPRAGAAQEMRVIAPAEIVALAETIHPRYRAVIYLAAYGGLRWGEVAALRPGRLNLQRGSIQVRESLADVSGVLITQPPKSGKNRSVSLPPFLCSILNDHLTRFSSSDYVFTSPMGEPLRRSNWYRRHFKPAVIEAGIDPGFRFHDLRHTCAALAIAQGAHPKAVQERLGHASIRLTLDTYGHLLPGLDERLCDDLEEAHFEALAASPRPESGIVVPFERRKTTEPPAVQGVHVERTTRFEPATLTLAR